MAIFDVLKRDHDVIRDLLEQLVNTSDAGPRTRANLFRKLRVAVIAHSRAEERVFYAPMAEEAKSEDLALEAEVEHQIVETLIEAMSDMDESDRRWMARLTVAKELLEHHFEEEENEMFDAARRIFDAVALAAMGDEMQEQEQQEMRKVA